MKTIITFIFITLSVSTFANSNDIYSLNRLLNTSDTITFEKLIKARKIIMNNKSFKPTTATALEAKFTNYLEVLAQHSDTHIDKQLENTDPETFYFEPSYRVHELIEHYRRNYGLHVEIFTDYTESISILPLYIYDTFSHYKTTFEKDVYTFLDYATVNSCCSDAALMISYQEVTYRMVEAEKLIARCPPSDNILYGKLVGERNFALILFMHGIDNSPAFSWEDETLLPEIKKEIEQHIKLYPKSYSAKVLTAFMNTIKYNNYKKTEVSETFFFNFLNTQQY